LSYNISRRPKEEEAEILFISLVAQEHVSKPYADMSVISVGYWKHGTQSGRQSMRKLMCLPLWLYPHQAATGHRLLVMHSRLAGWSTGASHIALLGFHESNGFGSAPDF